MSIGKPGTGWLIYRPLACTSGKASLFYVLLHHSTNPQNKEIKPDLSMYLPQLTLIFIFCDKVW